MPEKFSVALGRVGGAVREFTVAQRTLALIGLAGIALVVVALFVWTNRPTYAPLLTGLSAKDASAVVDVLESEGVAYELADGGGSVLVGRDDVYRMRLATAAAGLPADSSQGGYSLLDDMGMSSSEFQQTTTYKRALEGELAATIGALDGVRAASVRLALPEKSVFVSETPDATASVFVTLDRGTTLSSDQVQAVTHLVSASIEGMRSTDVAVVDSSGTVLSAVGASPGAADGGTDKRVSAYEGRVAAAVQTMLDRIVGHGRAVVSVTADLDLDNRTTTSEKFETPEERLPLTEKTSHEEFTGSGNGGAGVLGPDNIAVPGGSGNGDGTYLNESSTVTNAVDKITEITEQTPGTVRRQSVSVAVDSATGNALDMVDLQQLVATAAGIDTARGDVVTVQRMAFDTSAADAAAEALAAEAAAAEAGAREELIRNAGIAGVALLALIVLAFALRRRRTPVEPERLALDLGEIGVRTLSSDPTALALDVVDEAQRTLVAARPVDRAQIEADAKRAEVMTAADEDPSDMADRIRALMDSGARS
ncbi:flagellar basal-body MS-ring/collar protein FliF [Sanguibacter sp. HDW7]|uniref:flagellar basal-body MS-ring/collar protein FliF n=1 Tax=Sanguibacter sp. HDW7 TaxID=2714931 RepID=UPI00140C7E57|nr:flagellar basal-body MS-ring/collar protein FliF [Sanguibacter sp. HDW7]QIK84308.1 flagellar M-ring protein FliF [Sanguibacter sp. HDW7]